MGRYQTTVGRLAPPKPVSRWIMRGLALIAFVLTFYLLNSALKGDPVAGCGGAAGRNCNDVLDSQWSTWLGLVPVSLGGILVYGAMLVTLCLDAPTVTQRQRCVIWAVLIILSVMAAGSALWFVGLQVLILKAFCAYCLATHACGLVLASMVLVYVPIERPNLPYRNGAERPVIGKTAGAWFGAVGLLGVAFLVMGQVMFQQSTHRIVSVDASIDNPVQPNFNTDVPLSAPSVVAAPAKANNHDESEQSFSFLNGQRLLTPSHGPILGSPDAPHVIAMMFDYTCHVCRKTHHYVQQASQRYNDQLAVLLLPVPLDHTCNPAISRTSYSHRDACAYAKIALAVWKANGDRFAAFDQWLTESEKPPLLQDARAEAERLVGTTTLTLALADGAIQDILLDNSSFYAAMKKGRIPKFITESRVMVGKPASVEDFFRFLESEIGLTPES